MRKIKRIIIIFIIFFSIVSLKICVYANNEIEEEFDFTKLSEFLQDVDSEVDKIPKINARHAIVYDRNTGKVLYGKKENERCKMASTTKILTALITIEKTDDLEEKVKISGRSAGTGGSRLGLHKDDEITVNDLLYGLLLCSRKRYSSCTCRTHIRKCRRICKFNE